MTVLILYKIEYSLELNGNVESSPQLNGNASLLQKSNHWSLELQRPRQLRLANTALHIYKMVLISPNTCAAQTDECKRIEERKLNKYTHTNKFNATIHAVKLICSCFGAFVLLLMSSMLFTKHLVNSSVETRVYEPTEMAIQNSRKESK